MSDFDHVIIYSSEKRARRSIIIQLLKETFIAGVSREEQLSMVQTCVLHHYLLIS